jgi:hypothetical protein
MQLLVEEEVVVVVVVVVVVSSQFGGTLTAWLITPQTFCNFAIRVWVVKKKDAANSRHI